MVATKSCNTITPEEHLAVDAAGFVRLHGCLDRFLDSNVITQICYTVGTSSHRTLPKEARTLSGPGGGRGGCRGSPSDEKENVSSLSMCHISKE